MKKYNVEDLTGQRFGKLVVISQAQDYVTKGGVNHSAWLCKCDCGNFCVKQGYLLKCGRTRSCGCKVTEHGKDFYKHGRSQSPYYSSWYSLRKEGAEMCEDWGSVGAFCDWYEANNPGKFWRMERIDPSKPYSPANCHFVKAHTLTYKGEEHTYKEWEDITGIDFRTIKARILYQGWSVENALTIKPSHRNRVKNNE